MRSFKAVRIFRRAGLLVTITPLMAACSDVGPGSDEFEHAGVSRQALITPEFTAVAQANADLAETASSAFQNVGSTWEMVTTESLRYGCTRNGYQSWCSGMSYTNGEGGADPSLAYRDGPGKYLYSTHFWGTSLRVLRTTEPCPVNCGTPSWSRCDIGPFVNMDYPTAVWKSSTDEIWAVFANGSSGVKVVRINEPWTTPNCLYSQSTDNPATANAKTPRAAVDSAGDIHIVYVDPGAQQIRHVIFYTSSFTWSTVHNMNAPTVDSPGNTCLSSEIPGNACSPGDTLFGLGSTCLKARGTPDIAIDRTVVPNTLVVTYNERGSGTCSDKFEQRLYRSTGVGTTWTFQAVTTCKTSVHTAVRHFSVSGLGVTGLFQARSSYIQTGKKLTEVRWRSSDGGLTWSGLAISSPRAVNAPIDNYAGSICFWGDYEGIAPDIAYGSFFYSWASDQNPGPDWVIRGRPYDD
jgi:hypothetical protein